MVRPGGFVVFSHREDLYRKEGFGTHLEALHLDGSAETVTNRKNLPHLPGPSQVEAEGITMRRIALRVVKAPSSPES